MGNTFRQATAYMHTWLGVVLGFVLMAAFFFGSLSVFDRELDRWSLPETRAPQSPLPSIDQYVLPLVGSVRLHQASVDYAAQQVIGSLPDQSSLKPEFVGVYTDHRDPMFVLYVNYTVPNKPKNTDVDHVHVNGYSKIDPRTGQRLSSDVEKRVALGDFFFVMHWRLHLDWMRLGDWIVALSGMAMLATLVSGVVMHRRIFREFFTFRPNKARLRSTLDLHNLTGVVALPFLFLITFSGLLIFAYLYFPTSSQMMSPLMKAQEKAEETATPLPYDEAGVPGTLASVDAMIETAKAHWAAKGAPGEVGGVEIVHFGDANAYVSIARESTDRVAFTEELHFHGATGEVLYETPPPGAIEATKDFLYALHFQWFKHWSLRWLLFAGGLIGCVCIATGFLFFVEKRKKKHAASGSVGAQVIDALAVTTVTGMLIATCAIMLGSKVLPSSLQYYETGWLEPIFWFTWLGALIHAAIRSRPVAAGGSNPAWAEQCWAAAGLAVAAAIANWIATGDHLIKTISDGYWPVAGTDLVLLVGAGIAVYAALKLSRGRTKVVAVEKDSEPVLGPAE